MIKEITLSVRIVFDDPAPEKKLTDNVSGWVHAVKDVTRYYIEDSIDVFSPAEIHIDAKLSGDAKASVARGEQN